MTPRIHRLLRLAALAALSACGGDDTSLRDALDDLPVDTMTVGGTAPLDVDTVGFDTIVPDTLAVDTTAADAFPFPFPEIPPEAVDMQPTRSRERPTLTAPGEWTTGVIGAERPSAEMTVHTGLRVAGHPEFDRVVLEFSGEELPGYQVEYVDRPVRACGSGDVVRLPGDAWLEVRLSPSQAHDDRGRPTIGRRALRADLPNLLEMRLTCDFEGEVVWVLAVRSPGPFRVLQLSAPARLVVDVRR